MTVVAFTGQGGRDDDNEFATTSRLINCYLEQDGGRSMIKQVMGTEAFADLSDVFLRAMRAVGGNIYAACGGNLYKITSGGIITSLGTVTDGETVISSNSGAVTIAAAGDYYVYDDGALTSPTGAAFDDVGSVTYLGQFTVISERNGRRFAWSSLVDPTALDALDFASAETFDDNILRLMNINGYLVIFKEHSREVWGVTGSSDSTLAFSKATAETPETGLKSFGLVAALDDAGAFVGDDNIVYVTDGLNQRAISTRAVETSIKTGNPQRCFFYEDEGHKFVAITFPFRPAWVYDISAGMWHEREYGQSGAWPVVESVKLGSDWYVGTDLGAISKLTNANADGSEPLRKRAVSNTLYTDGQRFRVAEMELFANAGRGAASCWIRLSKDNGNTWGEEKPKSLGQVGEYDLRANWRSLGQFRRLTVELNWSDAQTFANEARIRIA